MADVDSTKRADVAKLTGDDEQFVASVIQESGFNKLYVKATSAPQPVGDLFFLHATNGGSEDLNVNGSTTPVEFIVPADPSKDLVVNSLIFEAFAGGIKIDKFLSLNNALTNGILIEVKAEDEVFQFLPITTTSEFDAHFAYGPGRSFEIVFASGNDSMVTRYGPDTAFIIKKQGTYASDDYIKVIVRDNLNSIAKINFIASGAKE